MNLLTSLRAAAATLAVLCFLAPAAYGQAGAPDAVDQQMAAAEQEMSSAMSQAETQAQAADPSTPGPQMSACGRTAC